MGRPKKTEASKVTKKTKTEKQLECIPIYKGQFDLIAPERKGEE